MEPGLWAALVLGLVLGVRHAFDADHLVAVSTIVSEYKNPLRAIWVGVSWGLGHTSTLLLGGLAVVFLGAQIPDRLALLFELFVGVMLVFLGLQIFWLHRRALADHLHPHAHEGAEEAHAHFHAHEGETSEAHAHHQRVSWSNFAYFMIAGIAPSEGGRRGLAGPGRPFFRLKSYLVGIVHGMAGSAALMLLALTSIQSPVVGLLYILVFGLGSVGSMGVVTIFISLPFTVTGRLPAINRVVQLAAGAFSIVFGAWFIYEVAIGEGLFLGG